MRTIFRRQARANVPSSHLQKSQLSNSGCQPQAKELSKTGRHLTILLRSSAHHDQGESPQHRSIFVRVSNIIEIALSPRRHLRVTGHDTGNGRRESQIATVLATERAVTVHPRKDILTVHLGQVVIAVRAEMTLKMRADATVVLQSEIRLGRTGMNAPVEIIGHPTEMRKILLTGLVEIMIILKRPLFVDYDSTPSQGVTSNLRQEVSSNVQITSIPALKSNSQNVRVEEPTLDSGATPTIDNNSLVFSSQPHNTIRYERADSQIRITQKSTRLHVLQVIANLNSVYHSYHHGEVIHPDFVQKFVDNLQLHHMGDSTLRASCIDWKELKRDFFISQLQALYPQNSDFIDMTFLQAIKDWRLLYDCMDETVVSKSFDTLLEIHHRYTAKRRVTRSKQ